MADGRSDPQAFAQEARRLIEAEKVGVIFGCWTSLCRRSVKSVVESTQPPAVLPLELRGHGHLPQHRLHGTDPQPAGDPGGNWCYETLKARKFFLAGSQDVQSYSVERADQGPAQGDGGPARSARNTWHSTARGMPELIAAIKAAGPDVVLSTVVGDGNKPFYQQLAQAGLPPGRLPVVSFTIAEDELRELPVKEMVGDYAAWSYFQSIDSPVNRAFVQRFKDRYGADADHRRRDRRGVQRREALGPGGRGDRLGRHAPRSARRSAARA